ncbi:MAG: lytic transglycosylase domain-containing protein [Saccharospirillaceae bacterium]|nr:lytic transglycosylase domain-containing protein [Saccharospirillaceae bacterium]
MKRLNQNVFSALFLCLLLITISPLVHANKASSNKPKVDSELRDALRNAVNDATSFEDEFAAQVWLVDMSTRLKRYIKDDKKRLDFLRMVHQEASRANLSPELVMALIHVESGFQRFALSVVGAQGYMQVMPFWKKEIGRLDDNLMKTRTNLRYGCTILKHYLKREKGDWIRALARYNGSLGRTKYPEKVMIFWEKYWFIDHR